MFCSALPVSLSSPPTVLPKITINTLLLSAQMVTPNTVVVLAGRSFCPFPLPTLRSAQKWQSMKNLPPGYVCESSALLIHHKVCAEFQSHREIT